MRSKAPDEMSQPTWQRRPEATWWRRHSDEISSFAWAAAGVGSLGVGALALLAYPLIGPIAAVMTAASFWLIALVCMMTAAIQHFFDLAFGLAEHLLANKPSQQIKEEDCPRRRDQT